MIEIATLKTYDEVNHKAGVQLAGSLTTYLDDIPVSVAVPASALVAGNRVILAIPGGNPKDAVLVATWPGGTPPLSDMEVHGNEYHDPDFEQQGVAATLIESHRTTAEHTQPQPSNFLKLSDTPSSYSGQAGKYVKVNAGATALEFGLVATRFTPKVTATALWRRDAVCDSSFYAQINGAPTATSVVYDNDLRELSLPDTAAYSQWGKTILHNITRGNARKITGINVTTNTITTESTSDDWADNDTITIGSQTCALLNGHPYSRFFDIDISAEVPGTASAALLYFSTKNLSGTAAMPQDQLCIHPWETYAQPKVSGQMCTAAYQSEVIWAVLPVIGQKFCLAFGPWGPVTASGMGAIVQLRGYWE